MEKTKVLVIHEREEIQRNIHNILSHFDFEFLYASNGLDGLAAAKYENPDLVIIDINLKVLDGISLGRMLHRDPESSNTKLIFLNDSLDYDFMCEARGLNAKGFLMAPYLDNTLVYTVKRALAKPLQLADKLISFEDSIQSREPIIRKVS